ncbi:MULTISPECIES: WYL domain-containing protein [unclassified Kribbella]|uniref:helix-turn-helix transcriptional regulator n=1 Tax=unclassified Kribbella TaxID=2644121 RepID=UPI0033E10088
MNRTDRLYAIREELRRAGKAGRTAEQLARTFEVSIRTIKRDITTLQHGGFPLWARPGPGGGYVVDPQATLPPVNFTEAEILGLAAAVASHRGQPFEQHARAVLTKILSVVDRPTRDRASALTDRVWTDLTGSPGNARVRRSIERALQERRVLVLQYQDHHGKHTIRKVDPVLIAHTEAQWYLVAHCQTRDAIRWFRFDRIQAAQLTAKSAASVPVESVGTPPETARALTDV